MREKKLLKIVILIILIIIMIPPIDFSTQVVRVLNYYYIIEKISFFQPSISEKNKQKLKYKVPFSRFLVFSLFYAHFRIIESWKEKIS